MPPLPLRAVKQIFVANLKNSAPADGQSLALDADRRDFREWLYAQLVRARKQRAEDGRGTRDLLVRSDKFSDYDTGAPYYWNELLGWTWKCDATLYTTADFKLLGLPTADESVEDLHETQDNTSETKTLPT
jgi:hypothetical protein